jgi:hypothetical protein
MSGKILNIVGVVWVVGCLVTLGYFAVRVVQIPSVLAGGMAAEPGPVKHLIPARVETPAAK